MEMQFSNYENANVMSGPQSRFINHVYTKSLTTLVVYNLTATHYEYQIYRPNICAAHFTMAHCPHAHV